MPDGVNGVNGGLLVTYFGIDMQNEHKELAWQCLLNPVIIEILCLLINGRFMADEVEIAWQSLGASRCSSGIAICERFRHLAFCLII